MSDFIAGKIKTERGVGLFYPENPKIGDIGVQTFKRWEFSPEAVAIFDAGRELWRYYHAQPKCNANASLYDIREHFQSRNEKGKMNNKSDDEKYNELIGNLRSALKVLAKKIEPKVYLYGFLRA